jgi:hypothetical protein
MVDARLRLDFLYRDSCAMEKLNEVSDKVYKALLEVLCAQDACLEHQVSTQERLGRRGCRGQRSSSAHVIVQKFPEQTACFSPLAPLFPDNVHYSLTTSTIPRQCPLFPDNVHYSPTCSSLAYLPTRIFAAYLPTRRFADTHICRHVPNAYLPTRS